MSLVENTLVLDDLFAKSPTAAGYQHSDASRISCALQMHWPPGITRLEKPCGSAGHDRIAFAARERRFIVFGAGTVLDGRQLSVGTGCGRAVYCTQAVPTTVDPGMRSKARWAAAARYCFYASEILLMGYRFGYRRFKSCFLPRSVGCAALRSFSGPLLECVSVPPEESVRRILPDISGAGKGMGRGWSPGWLRVRPSRTADWQDYAAALQCRLGGCFAQALNVARGLPSYCSRARVLNGSGFAGIHKPSGLITRTFGTGHSFQQAALGCCPIRALCQPRREMAPMISRVEFCVAATLAWNRLFG